MKHISYYRTPWPEKLLRFLLEIPARKDVDTTGVMLLQGRRHLSAGSVDRTAVVEGGVYRYVVLVMRLCVDCPHPAPPTPVQV